MVGVAIVGAAGYAGIEAVRLVLGHPRLRLAIATSAADAGKQIAEVYPALTGATDLAFSVPDVTTIAAGAEAVILAVPHTAAMALVPDLLDAGLTVVDMSADFRLRDVHTFESWYGAPHTAPDLLERAVFGLPELDRSGLSGAKLVACPGCYPTATVLAALPALAAGLSAGSRIIVDAKSGASGAGRTPAAGTQFVTVNEALAPYKVAVHRHTPEMEQALSDAAGREVSVTFVPHLVPMTRGLLSTVYLDVQPGVTTGEALEVYKRRYADESFVHVHDAGVMPSTAEVRGTNRASIGVVVDERANTLVAACAIDNLGKGAAGQALQCLNAALGFRETEGFERPMPVV